MADDHQSVDVTLGQETQCHIIKARSSTVAVALFECTNLQGVGNNIAVGDHDTFLYTESH